MYQLSLNRSAYCRTFVACNSSQRRTCQRKLYVVKSLNVEEDGVDQGDNSTVPNAPPSGHILAGVAVGLGLSLFLTTRLFSGGPSFAAMESEAVPLDVALSNGRPTVLEFYADYCEVCRELLPLTAETEKAYKDQVNFVMLNVENTQWTPEMLEYQVRGIPHFVFLDGNGKAQAAAVGRLPKDVLLGDVDALSRGSPLPYARTSGTMSALREQTGAMTNPRDHS
jgi:thiol-disulfide isomerase/thioredoxin